MITTSPALKDNARATLGNAGLQDALSTRPLRSAHVEQTREVAAHGPRRLHVAPVEDDPAAMTP